jgi:hypothetical protein
MSTIIAVNLSHKEAQKAQKRVLTIFELFVLLCGKNSLKKSSAID